MKPTSLWPAAALAILALVWASSACAAPSAGVQALSVPAQDDLPPLSGSVWSPCASPPAAIQLGPFPVVANRDCPIDGTTLPLIVISHGRGGSFLGHRDTAQALAEAGFLVATLSHPGDNAQDSARTDDLSVFVERPQDIARLIDYLLGPWRHSAAIDRGRIGFFGFSRGGYTGLVVVGANPRFEPHIRLCAGNPSASCEDVRQGRLAPLAHDARIKAAVIADPLSIFFAPDSFADVRVPIQLWRSESGGDGVAPESVALVAERLPTRPDFRTVAKAGHFAFLPPCPPAMAARMEALCTDAVGFDRAAFHRQFNAEVIEFFHRTLPGD